MGNPKEQLKRHLNKDKMSEEKLKKMGNKMFFTAQNDSNMTEEMTKKVSQSHTVSGKSDLLDSD